MAKKEIKPTERVLNCIPSRDRQKDWTFAHAAASGAMAALAPIPPSIDLREPAWWGVGDQRSTGSCVGWAAADSVLRWHFVKANRLPPDQPLSPRFIWMAAKETDWFRSRPTSFIEAEGTSLKAALDIARKYGAVRDSVLPFGTKQLYSGGAETFYATASQLKIASYFNLLRIQANWRVWLATKGPILTRLNVDATWDNATATEGHLEKYKRSTRRGGHAVALVGYTPDYFIVRNSWGDDWGDQGFAYASIAYARAAFRECYGVSL